MANGYHVNFHASKLRSSGRQNAIRFGAADDGAAAAVAAELGNWTAGQQTSLTKNVYSAYRAYGGSYALGTIWGFTAILWDSTGGSWRVRFRNINVTVPSGGVYETIAAILTGSAYSPGGVTALSAPPVLPNTGNPVVYVTSLNIIEKP